MKQLPDEHAHDQESKLHLGNCVQSNFSNPMFNGSHKFCWIKEVVGLSSHFCNPICQIMQ